MKVSESERKYLTALGIMLLIAALYYTFTLLWTPYQNKLNALDSQIDTLETQKMVVDARISRMGSLDNDIAALKAQAVEAAKPFFPDLRQDKVMQLINGLVVDAGLVVDNIQFSDNMLSQPIIPPMIQKLLAYFETLAYQINNNGAVPPLATIEPPAVPVQTNVVNIAFAYVGSYEQTLKFIDSCEKLSRTLAVNSLSITTATVEGTDSGMLNGTINMALYAAEKLEPDEYFEWSPPPVEGREDLFEQYYESVVAEVTAVP